MKLVGRIKIISVLLICSLGAFSQNPVNAYANVTNISGTSLSVNNVIETYHTFEDGDYVIVMQMQDNTIGANTTNVSTFGNLGSIQAAGLFEVAQISSHTEVTSLPNSITLVNSLVNTYNINANASVQIITFRFLGTNFTSTGNIGTLAWNGIVGGVTAISVTNVFTLNHNITADGAGFRGGVKNTPDGYSGCDNSTYVTAVATRYAGKGEGIYKTTNAAFGGARGKILNGGGGGNDVNSGGGGGGNYTSGGGGGSGWVPAGTGCSPIVGGLGGISLSSSISGARVFMGGGGGGGHENDGVGTVGGKGGGIIFIKAGTLVTAACAGISISANGVAAVNSSNDGAGGGGAGGSIIFQVNAFSVSGGCPLVNSANGGNGGNSNAGGSDAHGGGGGGGQGVIIYSIPQPIVNITTNTIPGTAGTSCGSCGSSVNGSAGSGTSNSGIVVNGSGPLPIELLGFSANKDAYDGVILKWNTAVEKNNKEYVIERMNSLSVITEIGRVRATGSNSHYEFTDRQPEQGVNYYRLKQIDEDGTENIKQWVEINVEEKPETITVKLYPNPKTTNEELILECIGAQPVSLKLELFNMSSRLIYQEILLSQDNGLFEVKSLQLQKGIYIAATTINGKIIHQKLMVTE